ncbi:MAG: altronate dehydratase family protein [Hyphomicrobiaceae bacterium]
MQDKAVKSTPRTLRLDPRDNIIVAVDPVQAGWAVQGVTATARIMRGHKMAVQPIGQGQPVLKFGQIIGFASEAIAPGSHVHTHNCSFAEFERDYAFAQDARSEPLLPPELRATFEGYRRSNGKTGTRNYIGVLTSVNCSASVARFMAEAVGRSGLLQQYGNVDGVVSFVHGTGCGLAATGEGYEVLERTQWGYAGHPNLAAALLVGLGCEVFQIARLKEKYGLVEGDNFRSMTIQDTGGTKKTIAAGVARIAEMLPRANAVVRETLPASEITLALQCGGSDGYSGITANPALGAAADLLVRHGGTAVLSETPEIYGAEHLLTRRARTRQVGEKLVDIIRWWQDYCAKHAGSMDNNPSPGNKAGGLTTILEKSLGAAAKGGTTTLNEVYRYAEPVTAKGFVYMDTPGYDPVAATGQVAGGCNLLCFTTGRGSAYGCKPTPSIKLATNHDIYRRMLDDMDIDCGDILDGVSIEAKGQEIFNTILRVASGEKTKSELLGYGDNEFVPWQIGATM